MVIRAVGEDEMMMMGWLWPAKTMDLFRIPWKHEWGDVMTSRFMFWVCK